MKHSTSALAVEDFFYWLVVCGAVFYLLYEKNNGAVRVFFFLGVLSGMVTYNHFISPHIVAAIVWVLQKIIGLIQKIWKILTAPWRMAEKKAKACAGFFQEKEKKMARFCKKRLKKAYKVFKIGICKM